MKPQLPCVGIGVSEKIYTLTSELAKTDQVICGLPALNENRTGKFSFQ
jgi:hypothetical protein